MDYNKLTEKEQIAMVSENDGYAIAYIDEPSKEVQLAVIQQSSEAIQYIKNPCKDVLTMHKLIWKG